MGRLSLLNVRAATAACMVVTILLLMAFGFGSPMPAVEAFQTAGQAATDRAKHREEGRTRLSVALIPILDSLPFILATQKGYFEDEHITVEATLVMGAVERLKLLRTGRIDGMMGEVSEAAIFNRDTPGLKIVMTTRRPYPGIPVFTILAMPGSGIESAADLAGVPLAITENTICEYVADRLLASAGLAKEEIVRVSLPAEPARFHLLINGRVGAAILPHPLSQGAVSFGAVPITDDTRIPAHPSTVLSFSVDSLREKKDGIQGFLRAWTRAAADINLFPQAYRDQLVGYLNVPPRIRGGVTIPHLPTGEVPTKSQWDDVVSWLAGKGLIKKKPAYEDSVTEAFLPARP